MTSEEAMAIEVLKGDMGTARALADILVEKYAEGGIDIRPTLKIGPIIKMRAIVYIKDDETTNSQGVIQIQNAIQLWLERGIPLVVTGIDRIELYELP